jgi:hypothetical protein
MEDLYILFRDGMPFQMYTVFERTQKELNDWETLDKKDGVNHVYKIYRYGAKD